MLYDNSLNRQLTIPNRQNLFNHYKQLIFSYNLGAILLDVRTIQEFNRSHLPNARHIAFDQLSNLLTLIKEWNLPIITYSEYGNRSSVATQLLQSASIKAVDGGARKTLETLLFNRKNKEQLRDHIIPPY